MGAEKDTGGTEAGPGALARLARRIPLGDEPPEFAERLPGTMPEPGAQPEAALLLAEAYETWGSRIGDREWPDWRGAALPARVRIAWLRAELHHRPGTALRQAPDELLYQAVRGVDVLRAHRLCALVDALVASNDPVLRAEALRLAGQGLHHDRLTPARARAQLLGLLTGPAHVAAAALTELAEPWAVLEPLPAALLAPLSASDGPVAFAALTAAARHGHRHLLFLALDDDDAPPPLRRRALALLGDLAERADIAALVAVAARDPLLFGGPLLDCLRGLHQRGHFVAGAAVEGVLGIALADHALPADALMTVLYTARAEAARCLLDAAPDDRGWPRRLDLLVALAGQGADDVPVGDAVTRLLPLARSPRPFLRALRALRHADAEEAVLALLPREPDSCLDALEAVGGRRTAEVLRAALGVVPEGPVAAPLRAVRHRAVELLWHLDPDPGTRGVLVGRLDPDDLPARVAADLGSPDERELALLGSHLDPAEPVAALCRLAAHGSAATLPVIGELLLRVVAGTAADAADPAAPVADGDGVPDEVLDAVRGLGRRLHARGKLRPLCLLDAADADEAGRELLAALLLDLIGEPGLSAAEQAVLLELLLRSPGARARQRLHRLLRHRDRHVRKQVIALLARDPDGTDARALSASLTVLTRADDIETVRQALLALGRARATGASATVAACLDHPNMNVKKAAALALRTAGTAGAVPKLLHWLGHHDNPGFRDHLDDALRGILGKARTATLRAAAERAADSRVRELLHAALGEEEAPDSTQRLLDLLEDAWDPDVALRLARVAELPGAHRVRHRLPDLLRLAESEPASAIHVLRFALRGRTGSWRDGEPALLARSWRALARALSEVTGEEPDFFRDRLIGALEAAAPLLPPSEAAALRAAVRALPPDGGRSTLRLLRAAGAVLVRADLDRELASARLSPEPRRAEEAVLHEAFGAPGPSAPDPSASRVRLAELFDAYASAGPDARAELLDRMTELQPLGVPPWTIAETPGPAPRTVRDGDLDQPRSGAQRTRLLRLLDAPEPERRDSAARALLEWPEPEVRLAVLRAQLRGRVTVSCGAEAARALVACDPAELTADGVRPERVARLAAALDPAGLEPLVPLLLRWWEEGPAGLRAEARAVLARVSADSLAERLRERIAGGAWGLLDLLGGRALLRTPELAGLRERLCAQERPDLADRLSLVDAPLRGPDAERRDAGALAALRDRSAVAPERAEPSRGELIALARDGSPEQAHRALKRLAERHAGSAPDEDPELRALLGALLTHPRPGVRLRAHRTSRAMLDRGTYLRHTEVLLADAQPDVVRTAVRTLAHAGWRPAAPALVELLTHGHPVVRTAAADGLVLLGGPAVSALRRAADRARPDRRDLYAAVLDRVTAGT
ncbi:HEAT repeat domain-containing protein [Streptomyces sp. NPDC050504]|uniref:HEAT repeat domain-containing protein n=1 Tax=Streptomyces sp. NPDC050504 TaxID=3365618 RepID=UPI0037AECDE7